MTTVLTPEVLKELNEKIDKAVLCALNKGWKLDEGLWIASPTSSHRSCCCPLGAVIVCHLDLTPNDPNWSAKVATYGGDELTFVANLLGYESTIINDFAAGFDGEYLEDDEESELYKLGLSFRKEHLGRGKDDPPESDEENEGEPGESYDELSDGVDEDPDLP